MPDPIVHYWFGKDAFEKLPDEIRKQIDVSVFEIALGGADAFLWYHFWIPFYRQGIEQRADIMQSEKTGEYLVSLAGQCRKSAAKAQMFSYLSGFLCHYFLDSVMHPYIIARSGEYDKTPETEKYRGNHMAFEHELDRAELEKRHIALKSRPMLKVFSACRLPESMKKDLDRAAEEVYGWQGYWKYLNRSTRDYKYFCLIMQDRFGLLYRFCRTFLKNRPQFTAMSYYHTRYENRDAVNNGHRSWRYPKAPEIKRNASYDEMFAEAEEKTLSAIRTAYEYVYENGSPETFSSLIGKMNYATGLSWDDPRNKNTSVYSIENV